MQNFKIKEAIENLSEAEWNLIGHACDVLWDEQAPQYQNYWRTWHGRIAAIGYVVGRKAVIEELLVEYSHRLNKLTSEEDDGWSVGNNSSMS